MTIYLMSSIRISLGVFVVLSFLSSCDSNSPEEEVLMFRSSFVEPSQQRSGDALAGYEYLTTGDYVGTGIPLEVFTALLPLLDFGSLGEISRDGNNQGLPAEFNASVAPNGVWTASPNCLTCHAGELDGEYIIGLGNTSTDYSINSAAIIPFMDNAVRLTHGTDSPEWEAYLPFREATLATGPNIVLRSRGVNPADRLTFVLAAHRNPSDLAWSNEAIFPLPIPSEPVPSDVPPWWLMKKKNAMFYTALGRGDFSRISMTSSLLTLRDIGDAQSIDSRFPDIMSYINSIEAPRYPRSVDESRAEQGSQIFENKCSTCHGTYGSTSSYPNLVIHRDDIGTDPALLDSYQLNSDFIDRYNNESWFGSGQNRGRLEISDGYLAPPLDGIWASAPYLHNGSVPNVEAVLNSPIRPDVWTRDFDSSSYDYQRLGWEWDSAVGDEGNVYDTRISGYGNDGHLYGDSLSEGDRIKVIEYLKTL